MSSSSRTGRASSRVSTTRRRRSRERRRRRRAGGGSVPGAFDVERARGVGDELGARRVERRLEIDRAFAARRDRPRARRLLLRAQIALVRGQRRATGERISSTPQAPRERRLPARNGRDQPRADAPRERRRDAHVDCGARASRIESRVSAARARRRIERRRCGPPPTTRGVRRASPGAPGDDAARASATTSATGEGEALVAGHCTTTVARHAALGSAARRSSRTCPPSRTCLEGAGRPERRLELVVGHAVRAGDDVVRPARPRPGTVWPTLTVTSRAEH